MKTFVVMSKLASNGPSLIEVANKMASVETTGRRWIEKVRETCPEVKFLAHYALLGPYDFMDIYQAPDESSAAKVSLICSADHMFHVESWTAIPDRKLAEVLIKMGRRKTDRDRRRQEDQPSP